ncbi:hypothetical protein MMC14_008652 [Varicellaria rhodocarpa]|nr:hypothetical protein [Varicellaria rhodocarpa]
MSSSTWAIIQLSRLLPLDQDSLKQIIEYVSSLSKEAAAEHLKNLLGDSPQALEFITSFNSRRSPPKEPSSSSQPSELPHKSRKKKPKAPLNKLPPPRRPDDYGNVGEAYHKKDEGDYMPGSNRPRRDPPLANALALTDKPSTRQLPLPTSSSTPTSRTALPKPPPSAIGPLNSDLANVRQTSRTSSPTPKAKIALSGGTSMHGASATINDLDSAIRALEIQTNPSLFSSQDDSLRRCNCLATRHPLLVVAPNCLNCGKIICIKEGIGPCTFCSISLLSQSEIQSMVRSLKEERGREKMDLNNSSQRRAEVSKNTRAFQQFFPASGQFPNIIASDESDSISQAHAQKDKLLTFQSQNTRRTHIIDEAADFETPVMGQSMWASPVERAAQLKRQQKVLREQEWNAKPEYEKRRIVISVDLVGGKVVRRMGQRRRSEDANYADRNGLEDNLNNIDNATTMNTESTGGTGAFGRNPLLGSLIRPVWAPKGKGKDESVDDTEEDKENGSREKWRRVQDDNDDNEAWILDGGIYGRREGDGNRRLGVEEHAFG